MPPKRGRAGKGGRKATKGDGAPKRRKKAAPTTYPLDEVKDALKFFYKKFGAVDPAAHDIRKRKLLKADRLRQLRATPRVARWIRSC